MSSSTGLRCRRRAGPRFSTRTASSPTTSCSARGCSRSSSARCSRSTGTTRLSPASATRRWAGSSEPSALEADAQVAAVAERLVSRPAAAAEREARVFAKDVPVWVLDPEASAEEERPVRPRHDLRRILRLLLRPAVKPTKMERAGRTRENRLGDLVGLGGAHVDPRATLRVEDRAEPPDAFPRVDAEPRLPVDLDPFVGVRPGRAPLLARRRLTHPGCRSRYERTKGQTGIIRRPRSWRSASAADTILSPRPCPWNAGSISVWISVTEPFRAAYTIRPASSSPTNSS